MDAPSSQGPHDLRGCDFGRYLVLGVLGRGGMGVVVEAHDAVLARSVALKLLSASAVRRGQLRLLREAQALARLSHPNVVQVYDVGELEGQTFIAMELVRGRTLRAWGREERRPWRTAVAVYLQAARGLAAAHDKGLVHRDFKPENCIIDDEGRVRVLDFGLAREIAPSTPTPQPDADDHGTTADAAETEEQERPSGHVLAESLTRPGALMGTLGYMAFEQLQGRTADAFSDQYGFCVSLYETLYGVAPYPGRSPSSLFSAMYADRRQPPPPGIAVPRRLSRALWQGLSKEPAKRWPSMHALIAELEALLRVGRSRALVGGLGAGIAAAVGLAFVRDDPCPDVATALADTWDDDARERVEQAFAAHGPDDPSLLPRLVDRLDGYANAWATMTRESCQATFVVRRQSEAQLEQRIRCLERRRNRLVATIDALADAADGDELSRAVVLPFRLPPLEPCNERNAEALEPGSAAVVHDERHAKVRRGIDEAATLWEAGRVAKGTRVAEVALAEARELDDAGLVAEALEVLARLQTDAGALEEANTTLTAAVVAASAAGDDTTATRAWLGLIFVNTMRGRHARAEQFALPAKAALARKDDAVLRAWLLNNLGILAADKGLFWMSRAGFEQSLELKQAALGPDHVDVGIAWQNLGSTLVDLGAHGAALDALGRAREIFLATLGDSHPWHVPLLLNVCRAERSRGRPSEAIAVCEGLLDRLATQSHPAHEARVRFALAEALWDVGRRVEALTMARRALELGTHENPQMMKIWTRWLAAHEATLEIRP